MYAQVCTYPNIAFAMALFKRYLSNPSFEHWKSAKKVLRYLQATKNVLIYKQSDYLNIVRYFDTDFASVLKTKNPYLVISL